MKKEYTDCVNALSDFAMGAHKKLSEPLEVSFLNVKLLIQDLEVRGFLDNKVKAWSLVKGRSQKLTQIIAKFSCVSLAPVDVCAYPDLYVKIENKNAFK